MVKIKMQKDSAPSGHKMATVLFDTIDVAVLYKQICRAKAQKKGFYMSNVRILKPGEKV
jgi:hypothetical protein